MISLTVNGKARRIKSAPVTPLLWVLREELGLTGAKYGCGIAQCGACTVHVDDVPVRACVTPVESIAGSKVSTIEGLGGNHPVQNAWIDAQVPQCGYCQPGMIMSTVALLKDKQRPTDADIDEALSGHICRCGTYPRIRQAIRRASGQA
jgi:isoquinoline 1-oxidoreductase subunit alpha